jgi:hypothetical protein
MLQIIALVLLCIGAMLGASGAGFFGVDLLVGTLCLGSLLFATASVLGGKSIVWGLLIAALALLALGAHVCLNLGVL